MNIFVSVLHNISSLCTKLTGIFNVIWWLVAQTQGESLSFIPLAFNWKVWKSDRLAKLRIKSPISYMYLWVIFQWMIRRDSSLENSSETLTGKCLPISKMGWFTLKTVFRWIVFVHIRIKRTKFFWRRSEAVIIYNMIKMKS